MNGQATNLIRLAEGWLKGADQQPSVGGPLASLFLWVLGKIAGSLKPVVVREIAYRRNSYPGAREFWFQGVREKIPEEGCPVRIRGILSPWSPYIPVQVHLKPAYSTQGWARWEAAREVQGKVLAGKKRVEYDTYDAMLYQDILTRMPEELMRLGFYYAGLYDAVSTDSTIAIPVTLSIEQKSHRHLLFQSNWLQTAGHYVEISGTIRHLAYWDKIHWLTELGLLDKTKQVVGLGIQAEQVRRVKPPFGRQLVLFGTPFFELTKDRFVSHFYDFFGKDAKAGRDRLLEWYEEEDARQVLYWGDFIAHPQWAGLPPKRNREIVEALGGC